MTMAQRFVRKSALILKTWLCHCERRTRDQDHSAGPSCCCGRKHIHTHARCLSDGLRNNTIDPSKRAAVSFRTTRPYVTISRSAARLPRSRQRGWQVEHQSPQLMRRCVAARMNQHLANRRTSFAPASRSDRIAYVP